MADVIRTPSLWDYLGQGATQGIENFTQAKDKVKQNQMQELGLAAQLFNSGGMSSGDFNTMAGSAGLKIKATPNKQERARKIVASPNVNPATGQPWTALETSEADLPTPGQVAKDTEATKTAKLREKYINDPSSVTDAEASILNLPTQSALEAGRALDSNKVLAAVGPKYIDTVIAPLAAQNGGLLPERFDVKAATEKAFALYSADRQANKLPVDPSVQAWFATQILDRMARDYQLRSQRTAAESTGINARNSAADRQMQVYTGIIESRRRMLDDLKSADKALALKMTDPTWAKDKNVIRANALESSIIAAQNAQAHLAGAMGAGLFVDEGGGAAAGGKTLGGATTDQVRPASVAVVVDLLSKGKLTEAQLKEAIGVTITQAEADAAVAQYNATKAKKK